MEKDLTNKRKRQRLQKTPAIAENRLPNQVRFENSKYEPPKKDELSDFKSIWDPSLLYF